MVSKYVLVFFAICLLDRFDHFAFCCKKVCKMDLGFILDGSGSIGRSGLAQEVQFIKRISSILAISNDQSRVSVMVFQSKAKMMVHFKDSQATSKELLFNSLDRIPYKGGGTNTEAALKLALSTMFQPRYGARNGVRKVLIVFTDGKSSSGLRRIAAAAQRLKKMGIIIITIGVGRRVSMKELHVMATAPTRHHVFTVNNPYLLKSIENKVENELCKGFEKEQKLTGNVARGKPSIQSSTGPWRGVASRGNDGNSNAHWNANSCTATKKQANPWWRVDLQKDYEVAVVKIRNRYDCCWNRLKNIQIRVGNSPAGPNKNSLCSYNKGALGRGEMKFFRCCKPIKGRYVFVTLLAVEILTLCEVEVFALKATPQPPVPKACKLDIGFVLDESGSIGPRGFQEELHSVLRIAKELSLSVSNTHVSVMTFASNAAMRIYFKDGSGKSQLHLERFINTIRYRGGGTNTEAALNLARSHMFQQSYGARVGITKVLIVFTDGRSKSGIRRVRAAAGRLKSMGINIISVGVGRRISVAELHALASRPTSQHSFRVPNANLLSTIVSKVKSVSCNAFTCPYAACQYGNWAAWSRTCGLATRKRTVLKKVIKTKRVVGGCAGLSTTCSYTKESKNLGNCLVKCNYVECHVGSWTAWSKTCGDATRKRTVKTLKKTALRRNCAGLTKSCTGTGTIGIRSTNCVCQFVECQPGPWSQWTASCGNAQRARKLIPVTKQVLRKDCSGLLQKCSADLKIEKRTNLCNCSYVECGRTQWSAWSTSCGLGTRGRKTVALRKEIQKPSCDGLVQKCEIEEDNEHRDINCTCNTVQCSISQWTQWSATCGHATRSIGFVTRSIKVSKKSCDGLPTKCPDAREVVSREEPACIEKVSGATCPISFKSIGCFKDNMKEPRPLPELILTERDRYHKSWNGKMIDWKNWDTYMMNLICRCAMKAKSMKYTFFGLQFFGECWSGPEAGDTYRKDGVREPGHCLKQNFSPCTLADKFCIGEKETNFVYQIA